MLPSTDCQNQPNSFYVVFDGHGATFMKNNAMKIFFEDVELPQTYDVEETFLQAMETCHLRSYVQADELIVEQQQMSAIVVLFSGGKEVRFSYHNITNLQVPQCSRKMCYRADESSIDAREIRVTTSQPSWFVFPLLSIKFKIEFLVKDQD
ncbi:hypothetical protein SASPL_145368 [Salvia splendens]|uniref:Uncharacterized protein n=1 Tax=Salvia splendens TaxID=180675 RepID=A0A8X8WGX4_SALSN|nr:hypothetical protein SASPL_145368 [Salvia splendens]